MDTGANPVERGSTYHGLAGTIPSSPVQSVGLEGRPHVAPDMNPSDKTVRRSQNDVHTLIVRNSTGGTIYAGRLMLWASGYRGKRVAGYVNTLGAEIAGVVDDHIGSSGVRDGDLFHLVVKGPCLALNSNVANDEATYSAADYLIAATADGTTAATGGRFTDWNEHLPFTATQATDGTAALRNKRIIGVAISASTTGNTGVQRLVDLNLG